MSEYKLYDFDFSEWDYLDMESGMRLFYSPEKEEGMGFRFYSVENVSYMDKVEGGQWMKENEPAIEILYNGIAYWDGMRHLYMGSEKTDNYGYDYYSCMENHIEVLKALVGLELKYCKECYESRNL